MALATVQAAAALAKPKIGVLPREGRGDRRCVPEIREGEFREEFVVGVIQGGAGTSTNMNANEVITNRALELLGHARGSTSISIRSIT